MRISVSALVVSLALAVSAPAQAQQQPDGQGDAAKPAPVPAVAAAPADTAPDHTTDLYRAQSASGKGGNGSYDPNQPLPGALNAPNDLPSALRTTDQ
jgi:hypothetical protein